MRTRGLAVTALFLACAAEAHAQRATTVGAVCADPARPCPGFAAHDLSFVLPRDEVARAESSSHAFWAVLLESGARCTIGEARRRRVQARFSRRVVFAQRFECDDESPVRYDGARPDRAFLAVHAGTRAAALALRDSLRVAGAFTGATVRRLRVVLVYP